MNILGIETSCDETSAAVLEAHNDKLLLKANNTASSLGLHEKTGGIIPEQAAREQIKYILPVIHHAITEAQIDIHDIDALAVTYGPGLIGSLLVGVETVKTLSFVLNKPIIPVNHMIGHIYANFIQTDLAPQIFPALALVASGGHTDLLLVKNHGDYQLLGGTRDDAAGEAFDKIGRLLGIAYPAGPMIEKLAKEGNPKRFRFPRPLIGSDDYEFSFSGLKTAVLREVMKLTSSSSERSESRSLFSTSSNHSSLDPQTKADLARATQDAIIDVLTKKTLKAAAAYNVKSLLLSGGVAANQTLRDAFEQKTKDLTLETRVFAPAKTLCTDNAAMIAAAAYYNKQPVAWQDLIADPELYFETISLTE